MRRRLVFLLLTSGIAAAETRAGLSFNTGFLTNQRSVAYALNAEFETYRSGWTGLGTDSQFSLRGDIYAFITQEPMAKLLQNYQMFFGLVYSLRPPEGLVPFVGLQPGLGLAQVRGAGDAFYAYPALSPVFGLHYLFAGGLAATFNLRYVFGELGYKDTGSVYLSELRGGLGMALFW